VIDKIQARITAFDDYYKQGLKKSATFAILEKGVPSKVGPPQTFEELKENKKIIA
jgi:hypothetical protein